MAEEPPAPPAQPPAKKTTRSRALSADTLEQLGARQLAELLMAQAKSDPVLARSLRLVLAGTDGGTRLATAVQKRLRTIQRSRGFIECDEVRPLVRELRGCAKPSPVRSPRRIHVQPRLRCVCSWTLPTGCSSAATIAAAAWATCSARAGADLRRLGPSLPAGILLRSRPSCWRCPMRTATAPPTAFWPRQVRR